MCPVNPVYINTERTGDVWVEDFDRGVVETMGAQITGDDYFVAIAGVENGYFPHDYRVIELRNTQMPGIQVIFAAPDDVVQAFTIPCVVVRRDSIDPADDRWPSRNLKYEAPAPGATQVSVYWPTHPNADADGYVTGWSKYERQEGAWPYDFSYMISVLAAGRNCTTVAQRMIKHIMRIWPPKDNLGVFVKDSLGDLRSYEAFSEGPIDLKEALDVNDRQAGFSMTLRIDGELDLSDPYFTKPVQSMTLNTSQDV